MPLVVHLLSAVSMLVASGAKASPAPPELVSPINKAIFVSDDPANDTLYFFWKGLASKHRFQLAHDASFEHPIMDTRYSASTTVLKGLPIGRYFWRVASSRDGKDYGPFSPPFQFRLTQVDDESSPEARRRPPE